MAGVFSTRSYEILEGELKAALAWLAELGIAYSPTRIGEYQRAIQTLVSNYRLPDENRLSGQFVRIVTALYEVSELIEIHKALSGRFDTKLKAHIAAIASGPSNYTAEAPSTATNRARNVAFELVVMAKLTAAGIPLDFSLASDVAASFSNRSILVECKRPQTLDKLSANVKDAYKQLEKKYANPQRIRHRGIIAIDITKIVNPEFNLFVQPNEQLLDAGMSSLVDSFLSQNESVWQIGRNKKTIAVLVRLSVMGINKGRGELLTYCQQFGISPLAHVGQQNTETAKLLANALVLPLKTHV